METRKIVSIIMAAYNAENTIEYAVHSVMDQTFRDWELLIIEDCSVDRTPEIIEKLTGEDSRIRMIRNEKNSGVSQTRLNGLRQAEGEWIAVLDSDDAWKPDKLEKQIETLKKTGADLVYTGSAFMDQQGNCIDWYLKAPLEISYRELLKQNLISNSSVLVRKELYGKYYALNDTIHEDFAIWLQLLKAGYKAAGIDEPLLIYRISSGSKSGNKWKSAIMNWNTYRYVGLNPMQAFYYEICYVIRGLRKYKNLK